MKLASIATALLSLAVTAIAAVLPSPDTPNAADIVFFPRAECTLHVRWVSNWSEDGWRRYRVKAWANRGGAYGTRKEMVQEWVNRAGLEESVLDHSDNFRGWLEGDVGYVDVNFWEGGEGHKRYWDFQQRVVNAWRGWSKSCDVDSIF